MTPQEFIYWLQGYFELSGNEAPLDSRQASVIRDHLALVMPKVTKIEGMEGRTLTKPYYPDSIDPGFNVPIRGQIC